jgi:hypothetical protein
VQRIVLDALPETRAALKFAQQHGRRKASVAYYATGNTGSKRDEPAREKPGEEFVVELDRTRYFDALRARYEDGSIENPAGLASRVEDFYKHFGAVSRVLEQDTAGNNTARWVRTGDDHWVHADLYCNAAMDLHGQPLVGAGSVMVDTSAVGSPDGKGKAGWDETRDNMTGETKRRSAWR